MKLMEFVLFSGLCLSGCVSAAAQQSQVPAAPSVTQIQNSCFKNFKHFQQQTTCIEEKISNYSGTESDPLIQEHIMYMHSLSEKVAKRTISENDARLALVKELKGLREQRQKDLQKQAELENEQNARILEIYRQNAPKPLELYQPAPIPRPVNTNCQAIGNQVRCTTY